jgi:hypothetical protein
MIRYGFDTEDLFQVARFCQPRPDDWDPEQAPAFWDDFMAEEVIVEGAPINGNVWSYYNDGEQFILIYRVDSGGIGRITVDRAAKDIYWEDDEWPEGDDFEANVWVALRILTDPAVEGWTVVDQGALPGTVADIETIPELEVEFEASPFIALADEDSGREWGGDWALDGEEGLAGAITDDDADDPDARLAWLAVEGPDDGDLPF